MLSEMPLVHIIAELKRELGVEADKMHEVVEAASHHLGIPLHDVVRGFGEDSAPAREGLKDQAAACLAALRSGAA